MGIEKVSVIGAGTMGHGIAEVFAIHGYDVNLYDVNEQILQNAMEKIRWSLEKLREKKKINDETFNLAQKRINTTAVFDEAVKDVDYLVEAVPEDLKIKRDVFLKADNIADKRTIFASNTSTIPISELASSTKREEMFIGLHFFNPPVLMPLVEIIRTEKTSDTTVEKSISLVKSIGKDYVLCRKDVPGFIVNRILGALINEAAFFLVRGEATVEQIDSMALYKLNLPMGLFQLADFTGIDVIYNASLAISTRDPENILVAPIFEEMYRSGRLGQKTGSGFYDYTSGSVKISKDAGKDLDPLRIIAPSINAACWLIRNGVATKEEIEKAVKLGLGFPEGILHIADKLGLDKVFSVLKDKERTFGKYYSPDPLLVELVTNHKFGVSTSSGFFDYRSAKTYETIYIVEELPVAWIYLNRPQRLNTITRQLVSELNSALRELSNRKDVRVVVITGEGDRAFSAGADLTSIDVKSQIDIFTVAKEWYSSFSAIEDFPKPVVAAINGVALGGGLELALACDFRLASSDAVLGLTETRLGLIPGSGGIERLCRLVGLAKAKEMVFLGERLSAEQAKSIGLVNEVYSKERFKVSVQEFAIKISKMAPLALSLAKASFSNISSYKGNQSFDPIAFSLLAGTNDANEGIQAMFEKREPEFRGE